MTQTLACPSCSRQLRVPDELVGCLVKCPACSHNFPALAEEPVPEPTPRPVPPPRLEAAEDDLRPRQHEDKPGKVQAIAIMQLIGGILALLYGMGWAFSLVGLCWPGTYYSFVLGILAIVKASQLLGERAYSLAPPHALAIMQIINILVLDVFNLTMGIISLVFLSDPEVKRYFHRPPR